MTYEINAVKLIKGYDQLGITSRLETVVGVDGGKMGTDVVVIVKFAVDDSMDAPVGRVERLGARGREIVDRKTNMAKSCWIGSAIRQE